MSAGKTVGTAAAVWLSVPLVLFAWLAYWQRESPLAVVADLPRAGLAVGAAGILLSGIGLLILRADPDARVKRGVAAGSAVAGIIVFGMLVWFRLSYEAADVRFAHDGVELAGTVFTPRGAGPYPATVLIHGSGPESRREYAFYGRFLARRGVAALAYDKRGVGESTGALYEADYSDYADDALAGVRLLAGRPEVDLTRIGVVGFSEGTWVAPLAATRSDQVAFVVIIGASGGSPAQQTSEEIAIRLRARGYDEKVVDTALALHRQVLAYQRTGEGVDELRVALADAREELWFQAAEDIPPDVYPYAEYEWWRSVMDFDPLPVWERVRVPVLVLKGGRDDRSAAEPMRARITAALAAGANHEVTVQVFPDADHMLLEWPRGDGTPPPAFPRGYPSVLADWILGQNLHGAPEAGALQRPKSLRRLAPGS